MPRNQGTSRKGKPKKNERAAGMGRALQKNSRRKHTPSASLGGMAMRQGIESINVTAEDNRASVLDVNDLDDFLIQAEMANREFASQKEQFVVLDPTAQQATTEEDTEQFQKVKWDTEQAANRTAPVANRATFAFQELSVPRRPAWDETTTPEELDRREKESFLDWRRAIAQKEEEVVLSQKMTGTIGVTPFEKNIEIWRQLWRVMERVSVIVQIVDARNPLFYLSKDLKHYATQELGKPMLLLVNKSDYLTPTQRKAWHDYLSDPEHPWEHIFFSAHDEQEALDRRAAAEIAEESSQEELDPTIVKEDDDDGSEDPADENLAEEQNPHAETSKPAFDFNDIGVEAPLSRDALLSWLWHYAEQNNSPADPKYDRIPFGMVGFPNVGKSSVINVLMGNAKYAHGVVRVGVASQPGKTKHFQTLLLPDRERMLLVDCPGLVFPSFVNNTADLIAAGVYPIAQMRDPWPVVNLLCKRIPRQVLNAQYGIQIPLPSADAMLEADPGTIPPPTAEEFLTTYCIARSMLASSSGVPDHQRASRIIIKEYATGKLLYCHTPPNFDDAHFQRETLETAMRNTKKLRDKLKAGVTASTKGESLSEEQDPDDIQEGEEDNEDGDDAIDSDDLLMEMMGESVTPDKNGPNSSRSTKRWGKKGRKLRNKDPYGCHSTPDDMLRNDTGSVGVTVMGGGRKNAKNKNYVRPTGYGLARSQPTTTRP
eukprot:Nitzschia sp. Nitz4//scaffold96_size78090//56277//58412//NITZ4_005501-RA/size78090-processed-gene-0.58-mRNA-1//-1//CDS//3329560594//4595//frame0